MRQTAQYPSAELPMLIGLSACLGGAGVLALFMYWLFQPLQLENPGMAAFQSPKAFTVQLATSGEPAAWLEQASVLAAAAANGKEGGTAAPAAAQASVEPKPKAKAKAVAQAKPRRPAADPYQYGYAPGYAQHPFSGFGRWF